MKNRNHKIIIKRITGIAGAILFFAFVSSQPVSAAADSTIYYQGKLTNLSDVAVANGVYDMVFKIYDVANTVLWTGNYTTANGNPVTVTNGIFSVELGSGTGNSLTLDFNQNYWLGTKVGSDSEMSPRKKINAAGYAINANNLNGQAASYYVDTSATAQTKAGDLTVQGNMTVGNGNTDYLAVYGGNTSGDVRSTNGALYVTPNAGSNLNVTLSSQGSLALTTAVTTGTGLDITTGSLTTGAGEKITSTLASGAGEISNGLLMTLTDSTSSTGGFSALKITDAVGTGTGTGSKRLLDLQVGSTASTFAAAGNLIFGSVNRAASVGGFNLLNLQSGSSLESVLKVDSFGDLIASNSTDDYTALDGTTTSNGNGNNSTSLTLTSATNFDIGNYIQMNSNNCGGTGINPCYAKITNKTGNTITITPALTWANGSTVNELHIPEIGNSNVSGVLENRYGRGYFIAGVVAGNASTYYMDSEIYTAQDDTGNTKDFTIRTGDATAGNSGNVYIDTGVASGTPGKVYIGGANADEIVIGGATTNAITIGAPGLNVDISGTMSFGDLSADWAQTAAFDVALANANSELKIMGSGGTYYGILDAGSITASDKTYTFPDLSGTVALTANDLSVFATTTSAQLSGVLSDENTSGGYMTDPMTTAGDIIYGGTSGVPTRLAGSGSNGYVLMYNTGTNAPYWAAAPGTGTVTSVDTAAANNGVTATWTNTTTIPRLTIGLGAITPTSVNGLTLTANGTGFSVAGGTTSKTLTMNNSLSFSGTDSSTLNIGTGGTLGTGAYATIGNYATLASPTFTGTVTMPSPFTLGATSVTTTGTQLNYLNAATGTTGTTSTNLVFSTSPTLVTPNIGAATATSITTSGVTAANGGITFDNTTDTIGSHTAGGTILMNSNILQDIGNTGTDFIASTGALTLAGILTANGGVTVATGQDIVTSNLGVNLTESDTNPSCAAGDYKIYADTSEGKIKKCQNGVVSDVNAIPDVNAFTDATTEAYADNDTTDYWDGTYPNLTPKSNASEILVMMSAYMTTGNATDAQLSARVFRNIGANPTCQTAGTSVWQPGTFYGAATGWVDMNAVFVDAPATTSNVTYTLCSDADGEAPNTVTMSTIQFTLFEINDAADLAEVYPTNDTTLEAGEIVSMDPGMSVGVMRSQKAYDSGALGVVSTKPAMIIGGRDGEGVDGKPIALSGRVPAKVSTENGPIQKGDIITSSSIPGVAMKATKAGSILGVSLGEYAGEGVGSVMIFVRPGNFNGSNLKDILAPNLENTTDADFGRVALQSLLQQQEQLLQSPDALSELFIDRVAAGLEIVTPKVTADTVALNGISAATGTDIQVMLAEGGKLNIADASGQNGIVFDGEGNATFAGTVTADAIVANRIVGLEMYTDKVSGIDASVAELASKLEGLAVVSRNENAAPVDAAVAGNSLSLVDLEALKISGALSVDGLATFKGKTIFEKVAEFFGDILVKGKAKFAGNVEMQKDVIIGGRLTQGQDAAGFAVIQKGDRTVRVTFDQKYAEVPIVVANVALQQIKDDELRGATEELLMVSDVKFMVTNVSVEGFEIKLLRESEVDVPFSWQADAVVNPRVSVSEKDESASSVETVPVIDPDPANTSNPDLAVPAEDEAQPAVATPVKTPSDNSAAATLDGNIVSTEANIETTVSTEINNSGMVAGVDN